MIRIFAYFDTCFRLRQLILTCLYNDHLQGHDTFKNGSCSAWVGLSTGEYMKTITFSCWISQCQLDPPSPIGGPTTSLWSYYASWCQTVISTIPGFDVLYEILWLGSGFQKANIVSHMFFFSTISSLHLKLSPHFLLSDQDRLLSDAFQERRNDFSLLLFKVQLYQSQRA